MTLSDTKVNYASSLSLLATGQLQPQWLIFLNNIDYENAILTCIFPLSINAQSFNQQS